MKKEIGYLGLGKMGFAQVERLLEKHWRVVAWNRGEEPREKARKAGAEISETIEGVLTQLKAPRLIWLMVPHAIVDEILSQIIPRLATGDTIIDGGNSFYKDSMRRARQLALKEINFLDVGTSGGPSGARKGACLIIGGDKKIFRRYEPLFKDLSGDTPHSLILTNKRMRKMGQKRSYAYVGKAGAGHFVKMVHNGIEYGMMQAIGEGFAVMKRSPFKLSLKKIADLYNQGSVIESRLVGWLAKAFKEHGENLKGISGEVSHSGEGLWTVQTAKELGVPVDSIKKSLQFRVQSKGKPSYIGQVVSALRNQFGGHTVSSKSRMWS